MGESKQLQGQPQAKAPKENRHTVGIVVSADEWRMFRAILVFQKQEIGTVVGSLVREWMKQPAQKALATALAKSQ